MKPRLLDAFCKAGGCTKGYQRAGFYVVGVDIEPQPNYCGDEFIQADALEVLREMVEEGAGRFAFAGRGVGGSRLRFDGIHASPPCQAHSQLGNLHKSRDYPDLVAPTRDLLVATGLPYVIENVEGAPLVSPVVVCGSSLGLDVRRHRLFETNWPLMAPPCAHGWQTPRFRSLDKRQKSLATVVGVHGHLNYAGEREERERAMGIDWMTPEELTQAIPPAMTELIGHQLMQHVKASAAA